jgi:hypothetical protein
MYKHDPVWIESGYYVILLDVGYHEDNGWYELTEEAEKIYEECGAYAGTIYSEYNSETLKVKIVYKK